MNRHRAAITRWARWLGTFVGFPLAGVTARLAVGDVDSARAAVIGGLLGGAVLGAVQAGIGGIPRSDRVRWIAATAVGLALGLGVGAPAVDFQTGAGSLAVMGLVSGAGVGLAQALSVPMLPVDRVLWAVATPLCWAGGWLITSQVIVDADSHHAVFGSSGALVVSAVLGVLHAIRRPVPQASRRVSAPSGSAVA